MATPEELQYRSIAASTAKDLIADLGREGALDHTRRSIRSLLDINGPTEFMYGWALIVVAIVEADGGPTE